MTKQATEQVYVSVWLTCKEVEEVMLGYEGRPVIGGDVHIDQNAQHLHKQVTVNVRSLHTPHHTLHLGVQSTVIFPYLENIQGFFWKYAICGHNRHLTTALSAGLVSLTLASCM